MQNNCSGWPADNSKLSSSLEFYFNSASLVASDCEKCKKRVQVEVRTQIRSIEDTKFITVLLSRGRDSLGGFALNMNRIISTEDMFIR